LAKPLSKRASISAHLQPNGSFKHTDHDQNAPVISVHPIKCDHRSISTSKPPPSFAPRPQLPSPTTTSTPSSACCSACSSTSRKPGVSAPTRPCAPCSLLTPRTPRTSRARSRAPGQHSLGSRGSERAEELGEGLRLSAPSG